MISDEDCIFLYKCRGAIKTMKASGMHEYWIATCISEIRSAAIHLQHQKVEKAVADSYTDFMHPQDMINQIKEVIPEALEQ